MKVEVTVLGSPSTLKPYGFCGREVLFTEVRSCVKVKVVVLGSPSLIVLTVSVDVN